MRRSATSINSSVACLLTLLLVLFVACRQETPLKVLQFNIWHEGTAVEGGVQGIIDNIAALEPDFVTFCEVNNTDGQAFIPRLITALAERGQTYYGETSTRTAILSKYKIDKQEVIFPKQKENGYVLKATATVQGQTVVVYAAHLDYTRYACYLPRGYSGTTWKKLDAPVTDVDSILTVNRESFRDEAIAEVINDALKEQQQGHLVIVGGDFNEPSHLDWTEATRDLFDRRGAVVPWDCSVMLYQNGFLDAYRVRYPDPVTHPGFTFPTDNEKVDPSKLTWAPEADERDRIDFIYYMPDPRLQLKDAVVVGPAGCIVNNQREASTSDDPFILPTGTWPTDHKAVMATFVLR